MHIRLPQLIVIIFTVAFAAFSMVYVLIYREKSSCISPFGYTHRSIAKSDLKLPASVITAELRKLVYASLRHLSVAHRYARSGKALQEISDAFDLSMKAFAILNNGSAMHDNVSNLDLSNVELLMRDKVQKKNKLPLVCPEIYMGNLYGYGFYFTGHELQNCTALKPFRQVVSILMHFGSEINVAYQNHVLSGVQKSPYSNISLVVAGSTDTITSTYKVLNLIPISITNDVLNNPVKVLQKTLSNSRTEYVLISRNLELFDEFARLERLVRVADELGADVVAGSQRNAEGRWTTGCYQIAMKNYTLRLIEGYDLSTNSCIYCDYSSAPFVVKREFLKSYLDSINTKTFDTFDLLYLDLFLTIRYNGGIAMSCPDAMFHTKTLGFDAPAKTNWLGFVHKWELNRLVFPDSSDMWFTCKEAQMKCTLSAGIILPLCCFKQLTDCLNFAAKTFDQHGLGYELDGGTAVAAAKLQNTLPWERDHDVNFRSQNISALMKLQSLFKKEGYSLVEDKVDYAKCLSSINCGFVSLYCSNWRIELWGVTQLANDIWAARGVKNFTKVQMGGPYWMNGYPDPSLFARNKYADDIYKHAEHWVALGAKTGWVPYKEGTWMECPRPGFHGCLRNYLPVGNLQFRDLWI